MGLRFGKWLCLVLGAGFLIIAVVTGVLAVRSAMQVSAYRHARACLAGAAPDADCRQDVTGAVSGVVEIGGKNADYALDVLTATGTLHMRFPSDSAMLSYAVDGNPAVVTMWRGIPVAVTTDGRTEDTSEVPATALAQNLTDAAEAGGVGVFFVLGGLATRRNQRAVLPPVPRPAVAAMFLAAGLGALVIVIGGFVLGGKAFRLGPVLASASASLVVVAGLSTWFWIAARRRLPAHPPAPAAGPLTTGVATTGAPQTRIIWPQSATRAARWRSWRHRRRAQPSVPLRIRLRPAAWLPIVRRTVPSWAGLLLTVTVLLALLGAAVDGPSARAFRHAPACAGATNLAICTGDFTAVVNGYRTPADNGDNYTDVSYVTADGVINTWIRLDGNGAALGRAAAAAEKLQTPLTIRVWRKSIVGADLGGTWHWAPGDPPGDAIPVAFLSVSFGLLLLVVWLRVHRLSRRGERPESRLILQDLGQAAAGAGVITLLAYGFWPAAFLMLAVLAWLGLSARSARRSARSLALVS